MGVCLSQKRSAMQRPAKLEFTNGEEDIILNGPAWAPYAKVTWCGRTCSVGSRS